MYIICELDRCVCYVPCFPIGITIEVWKRNIITYKNKETRRKEIVKQLGQIGIVLGVFAAAAFAVKHILV